MAFTRLLTPPRVNQTSTLQSSVSLILYCGSAYNYAENLYGKIAGNQCCLLPSFTTVRTILVLGYRVLANTGRYCGGSGIGRYFLDCETRYRLAISAHAARRCLLSKPQSNSSRRRAAATIQLDLDLLCLLYTSPSPRDRQKSRMPSSA